MYGKIPGTKVKPSGSDIVEEFSKNKSLFAPLKVTENLVKLIKTADKLNTKQGTDNSLKATTQQQTQKAIPKVTQGKDGTLIATPGRKDSFGKDGRIWDVPTLIPINKSKN